MTGLGRQGSWDVPGGPVVRTWRSYAGCTGLIPGQRDEILHVSWCGPPKDEETEPGVGSHVWAGLSISELGGRGGRSLCWVMKPPLRLVGPSQGGRGVLAGLWCDPKPEAGHRWWGEAPACCVRLG